MPPSTLATEPELSEDRPNGSKRSQSTPAMFSDGGDYLNNASLIAPVRVDVEAPIPQRDRQIVLAVWTICPEKFQGPASARSLSIRQLGGGLSNHLFIASSARALQDASDPFPSVLVRVHGEEEEEGEEGEGGAAFVDREVENRILAELSSRGLAPTFHGRFLNGRVEEFYDGYRPLSWTEMSSPRFAGGIAEAMARLHRIRMPEGVLPHRDSEKEGGEIWKRVEGWFDMARGGDDSDAVGEGEDGKEERTKLETMHKEWQWLKAELRGTLSLDDGVNETIGSHAAAFCREIVFSHMDCQSLNILVPCYEDENCNANDELEKKAPVRLIDFEYAGMNPRAADVANTFCEHCNMNNLAADYEAEYPTPDEQDAFLRRYVAGADIALARRLDEDAGDCAWTEFLSAARDEVGRHTLISHLGWAVWAAAQSRSSAIEFDYLAYAELRMDGYWLFKARYWPSSDNGVSSSVQGSRSCKQFQV